MAAQNKSASGAAKKQQAQPAEDKGHLSVSELISDRAAAPSPFGDDQTFPLPVDRLNFIPPTPA